LFTLEPDGVVTSVDGAVEALTGQPASSLIGGTLEAIVDDHDRARTLEILNQARRGTTPSPVELRFSSRVGEASAVELTLIPHCRGRRVVGISGLARDVGQRARRERQFAAVQDVAHVGVWEWDLRTGEVVWSDELYRIYGLPLGKRITLETFLARVVPQDRERVRAGVARAVEMGGAFAYSERIERGDGVLRHLDTLGEAVRDPSGQVVGLVGTCRDVTEQRERSRAIQLYADIIGRLQIALCVWHLDDWNDARSLRLVELNPGGEAILGLTARRCAGRTMIECLPGLFATGLPELFAGVVRSGEPRALGPIRYADANVRPGTYLVTAIPLPDGCVGISIEDVTDRVQVQEALGAAEARYRELVESVQAIVWRADVRTMRFSFVSHEAEALLGYPVRRWIEEPAFWRDHVHPEDRERALAHWARVTVENEHHEFEFRMTAADGRVVWLSDVVRVILRDGEPVELVGAMFDITERKHAEALKAAEGRVLELIASRAPLKETFEMIVRLIEEQADGMLCSILLIDDDGNHLRQGAAPSLPQSFNRGVDGEAIGPNAGSCGAAAYLREPVVVTNIVNDPRWRDYRDLAIAHGLAACWSTPILTAEGALLGTFAMYYRQPRSPTAEHERLIESAVRLARIAIERQRNEDALRLQAQMVAQYQKMEVVGQLAGGIAHDFNNLLSVIAGYGDLLLRQLEPGHPARGRLEHIVQATDRGARLTRQLLTFSRSQVVETKVLDLNNVVAGVDAMLGRLISENVQIETDLARDLGVVRADPGQIEQVIMNLAINARDAMPRGGRIMIRTANVFRDIEDVRSHPEGRTGRHVMLEVSDTGEGMDGQTLSHMFEPFFTTKAKGKGTGLGLAVVYGIVRQAGGHITISSDRGRGTTLKVYLPRIDGTDETGASPPPLGTPLRRSTETILLVEDDAAVRELTREMLEANGYTVIVGMSAAHALSVSSSYAGPVHLILTDVMMPGLGGPDVAARVQSSRPGTRVVYMSGYVHQTAGGRRLGAEGVDFLQKPFTQETLLRKIQEALDRPRPEASGS
jgi:two-component system, cell cycle sensor histidine kinase and response regulator CckA